LRDSMTSGPPQPSNTPAAGTVPRRRYAVFAAMAVLASLLLVTLAIFAVDVYLHKRHERSGGVNVWGYRGPVVSKKQPGEVRVAVFGGSSAFGYGVLWQEAFPYLLEERLNAQGGGRRFSVVNLAYNNEGAYSFRYTMRDYEYLRYDIAILYEGYNDAGGQPRYQVFRHDSPVYRLTGYLPIFPIVIREKAWAMRYGDVNAGYHADGRTVFRPGLATEATSRALEAAAMTAESIERQLGRLTRDLADEAVVTPTAGCTDRWRHYCGAVHDAITWARARGIRVIVGTQPYVSDTHIDQQNALMGMLREQHGDDHGVVHVNLGRAVDLRDPSIAFDGMHLNAEGNRVIAGGFVDTILEWARTDLP
jgi:hypothetical protein